MATNVSEKDKTLNEIIDYCKEKWGTAQYESCFNPARNWERDVYEDIIHHCESMLGYSGSMPSEVPNQSEDAK